MRHVLHIAILLCAFYNHAQVITFDDQGHEDNGSYGNPYSITNNGEIFVFAVSGVSGGPTSHRYRTTDSFGCGNTGLNHLSSGTFSATTWTIETQSGNEINLASVRFDNFFQCYSSFAYNLTLEGFKNNVSTGSQSFTVGGMNAVFNANSNFDDIDKVVISCSDLANLGIDDFSWQPSVLSSHAYLFKDKVKLLYNKESNTLKVDVSEDLELKGIHLFSLTGARIASGLKSEIATLSLAKGLYVLKIDLDGSVISKKVIVE